MIIIRLKDHVCPRCGHRLERVHRLLIQKLLSLFFPVHRYRCLHCQRYILVILQRPLRAHPIYRAHPLDLLLYAIIILFFILILTWIF